MKLKIQLGKKLTHIFTGKKESTQVLSDIEEILIASDFGIDFTQQIIEQLSKRVVSSNPDEVISELKNIIKEKMVIDSEISSNHPDSSHDLSREMNQGSIVAYLMFGVNGTGKTTTCGKLAYKLKNEGKKTLIAAADTHRDAAVEQLAIWSKRANVPIISQYQGSDPGAVVYDACDSARARSVDALIVDTAGRLHNKERLMEELKKIVRILDKKLPEAKLVKLLTVDATTGQNAIAQATQFNEYAGVDGIVLTKLDSSAKGGIACTISGLLKIPILYSGTGEGIEDLADFDVDEYLDILLS
ncbi:MAG: signal recognition particle-docking protein FtsY [Spirochaetota bacterium]|nr:MAG: signal recognition particle-docking protein FtsY [Spirochaetota bacterium]